MIQTICPECGKSISLRGLNGHLRFEHHFTNEKAKQISKDMKLNTELMDFEEETLKTLRRLKEIVNDMDLVNDFAPEHGVDFNGVELKKRLADKLMAEYDATKKYLSRLSSGWGLVYSDLDVWDRIEKGEFEDDVSKESEEK